MFKSFLCPNGRAELLKPITVPKNSDFIFTPIMKYYAAGTINASKADLPPVNSSDGRE